MSWNTEVSIMIRTLINDFGPQYEYTDDRLEQVAAVAAQYVQSDANLDQKYNINILITKN
jgi:hypothetical protein